MLVRVQYAAYVRVASNVYAQAYACARANTRIRACACMHSRIAIALSVIRMFTRT